MRISPKSTGHREPVTSTLLEDTRRGAKSETIKTNRSGVRYCGHRCGDEIDRRTGAWKS